MDSDSPKPLKILIAEANSEYGEVLTGMLRTKPFPISDIDSAESLDKTLAILNEKDFDIVLLELDLPDSGGLQTLAALQGRFPYIPVVVITDDCGEELGAEAVKTGAQDYLVKGMFSAYTLGKSIRYAIERKKTTRDLQLAENKYRTIFENSAVAIMMANEQECLVSWNKYTEKLLGMNGDDLCGKPVSSLYPAEEWNKIRAQNIRQKGIQHHSETRIITKDGKQIDADISLSVLRDSENEIIGSIGVLRDISLRKQAEERAQTYLDIAGVVFVALDSKGEVVLINKKGCEVLGRDESEVIGKNWFDNFLPDNVREEVKAVFKELILGNIEAAEYFENPVLTRDGIERTIAWHNAVLRDKDGAIIGTLGSGEDITERKKADEQLRESEKRIKSILRQVQAGVIIVAEDTHEILFVNSAAADMAGMAADKMIGMNCQEHICPAQKGKCPISDLGQEVDNSERVLLRADGKKVDILKTAKPIDLDNRKCLIETFVDISRLTEAERQRAADMAELKQARNTAVSMMVDAEKARRETDREKAKLSAMISGMEEGVVFADADSRIVEVNEYFCRFVGAPKDKILGKEIEEFHQGETLKHIDKLVERFRQNIGCEPITMQRRLGGAEVILRMQPIYGDNCYQGVLLNVINVTELVEARKQAEKAREEAEEVNELLMEATARANDMTAQAEMALLGEPPSTGR